jgi:FSR family fosmidomycin resistance protein-like MFS transporter
LADPGHPAPASRAAAPAREFHTGRIVLIATAHFVHDTYPAFLAPLLPLLRAKHGLSHTLAGTLATFLRSSALVQPFIGYFADRTNVRLFVILAPAGSATFMSLLGAAPSYLALALLLILAGLSHAAFHAPAPAMVTRVSGGRWGKGMGMFMVGGEMGRAAGPLCIVGAVSLFGLAGSAVAALPGIVFSVILSRVLAPVPRDALTVEGMSLRRAVAGRGRVLACFFSFMATRALTFGTLTVFLPSFLVQRGASIAAAGLWVAGFEAAGAAGALAGGTLSDRLGRRRTILGTQVALVALLFGFVHASGPVSFLLMLVMGACIFATSPVALAIIQELMPGARGTASGLYFSVNYMASGLTAVLFGALSDALGITGAFRALTLAPLVPIPFILLLPETRRGRQ